MATWDKTYREAVRLQEQADLLFERANDQQCPHEFKKSDTYGERRCLRDSGHTGVHHLDNYDG